jgi:hypothetical protein
MKEMLTKTITVQVSAEVKAEFDQTRECVDAAGFDVGVTLEIRSRTPGRYAMSWTPSIERRVGSRRALAPACSGIRERVPRIILLWNGVWFSIPGAIRSMMSFER